MSILRTLDVNKNLLFWKLQLSIWINKKMSICVEPGAVDDIEYARSETRSGHINRVHTTVVTHCLGAENATYFTIIDLIYHRVTRGQSIILQI